MTFIRFFNQIKASPPIKKCTDCKYYLLKDSYANNKCSDTGVNKFEYAYIARADVKICGPKGVNFLPNVKDIKLFK